MKSRVVEVEHEAMTTLFGALPPLHEPCEALIDLRRLILHGRDEVQSTARASRLRG